MYWKCNSFKVSGPLAHAWLEQQTHNLLVLCSTHRRPTKTKPQPSPAGVFRYCTPQRSHLPATLRQLQAAQHPSQYQCGTLPVIAAYAARYVAQFGEAAQAAFD